VDKGVMALGALFLKYDLAVRKLVEPARAAANQMKDAGMHRGADPVLAVLFEIDASLEEQAKIIAEDPTILIEMLARRRPDADR
jgi:hypothetical protein